MIYIDVQIEEQNLSIYGITGNVFVNQLSKKQFTLTNLLTEKTPDKYQIQEPGYIYGNTSNNVITVDWKNQDISTKTRNNTLYPNIISRIIYTDNSVVYEDLSFITTFINYQKPQFIYTACTAKRNGQLSGKVYLNLQGTYYNGIVGNVDQSGSYKPTIKYKFWKSGTTEPSTYDNTISASDISINNGAFSVTNLEIGSDNTSATNYFDFNYSYNVKVSVEDTFGSLVKDFVTCVVTRGKAIWTEYADRVDFEKITTRNILADNIDFGTGIATVSGYTVTFNKTFASPPCVVVTPVTTTSGVIAIKISNVTTTGFTATTGGTIDFGNVDINWIAMN